MVGRGCAHVAYRWKDGNGIKEGKNGRKGLAPPYSEAGKVEFLVNKKRHIKSKKLKK
jgi:hypothetical protein